LRSAKRRAASPRKGNRRDVGGIQVEALAHDGKIAAYTQRIIRILPIVL
jgi:hypothetical protein